MKKILQYFTILSVLLLSISTGYGQMTKSTGTRITDNMVEKDLRTNAILELESTSKGFYLPRMTTAQRDALLQDMTSDNGLAVYNIDNDCVEYWSSRANKWMSLCGTLPPAEIDLQPESCNSIAFTGFTMVGGKPQVQQGTPLSPEKQYITLMVRVNQIGTYSISATTDNGYFFSGEGQFQALGTYPIILKGMGTPTNGYTAGGGDTLKFIFNGKESTVCSNTEVLVIPADLKFQITNATAAEGTYQVGVAAAVANGNKIVVDVKVENGGTAIITAKNQEVGLTFRGTKELSSGANEQIVLEPVSGERTPTDNTQGNYILSFDVNTLNSAVTINDKSSSVVIEKTKIEGEFDDANFGTKPYYQGTSLTEDHTIELPIKVISSGKTNLFLKGSGGIEFKAENVFLTMPENATDLQVVEFKAVGGTLPTAAGMDLTLSGDNPRFEITNGTTLHLPITKKPVQYSIDCATIETSRKTMPNGKPVGEDYTISVMVDVVVAEEYEINTSTAIDGILFSTSRNGVKQVFPRTGRQKVTLYAVDGTIAPTHKGEYTVALVANDASNAQCNQVKLKVGYNDINILILAGQKTYGYSSSEENTSLFDAKFFTGTNSNGKQRFGESGDYVETGDVSLKQISVFDKNFISIRTQLVTEINAGAYNFILVLGAHSLYAVDQDLADALSNYVTSNKGVLWVQTRHFNIDQDNSREYFKTVIDKPLTGIYGEVIQGGNRSDGYNMLKRFNGGKEVIFNNYSSDAAFNMIVVDPTSNLTKPRNGFDYVPENGGGFLNIHWAMERNTYQGGPRYSQGSFDTRGGEFKAIVADRGAQYGNERGLVFAHPTYENLIWAPTSAYSTGGGMLVENTHMSREGEPYHTDQVSSGQVKTNVGAFMANILSALMEREANK